MAKGKGRKSLGSKKTRAYPGVSDNLKMEKPKKGKPKKKRGK